MPRFEASKLIPRPPSEVFALVSDGARVRELGTEPEGQALRRQVAVEHVGGPRVGAGATYRAKEHLGDRDMGEIVFTTADYEPDRRVAFSSNGSYDVVYELEEEDGGTRLTCAREYDEPRGLVRRLAGRVRLNEEAVVPLIEQELAEIDLALRGEDPSRDATAPKAGPDECCASTTIALPPSAVFAFVANPANMARWLADPGDEGAKADVEHLSGPLVGLHARYRLIRWSPSVPRESHELYTIEYEPDRRVAFRFPGRLEAVYTVEPVTTGSRLTELHRPVENPRGIRERLVARSSFVPARVVPNIEWRLARIKEALWVEPAHG